MPITPRVSDLQWLSSEVLSVSPDGESFFVPDQVNGNLDELAAASRESNRPILLTLVGSTAGSGNEVSIECKDPKAEREATMWLSRASNALRRLSKEDKESHIFHFNTKERKPGMTYKPTKVFGNLIRAIRDCGRDYVIVQAPQDTKHFLERVYLSHLFSATCSRLHRSLVDIQKDSEDIEPYSGAEETLKCHLGQASEAIKKLAGASGPFSGSKVTNITPTENDEKLQIVQSMLLGHNRPENFVDYGQKVPGDSGEGAQPFGAESGARGLSTRFTNSAVTVYSKPARLRELEIGVIVFIGIENAFLCHTLQDGRVVYADHIFMGYVTSDGRYNGKVSKGPTIPEEYKQFWDRLQLDGFDIEIGTALAAFHKSVNPKNWSANFSCSGTLRFDYIDIVTLKTDWDPWGVLRFIKRLSY